MDKLKLIIKSSAFAALLVAMSQAAVGQAIYVYPLNAQSDEQLSKDRRSAARRISFISHEQSALMRQLCNV